MDKQGEKKATKNKATEERLNSNMRGVPTLKSSLFEDKTE